MKKFYYLVRMTFLEKMAYTKAVWFNTIGTLVSIFSYYFLWKIVFMRENELVGFTMGEMITYVILSKVLSSQFAGGINMQFAEWVYEGTNGTELLRPVTLFYTLFARRSGEFAYFILWKGIPVSLISFFILRGVGPAGAGEFLLFLISVLLALVILFYVEFMVGLASFYTLSMFGMAFTKTAVFAGMVSVPLNIFLGKYRLEECMGYMGLQIFWCIIMGAIAHLLYHMVIRKVIVQGG